MNHREPPHPSAAVRQALLCLAPLLLTAVTPHRVNAIPRRPVITFTARVAETIPYLPINGAPPLRFAEAPAPVKPADPLRALSENTLSASAQTSTPPLGTDSTPVDGTSSSALSEALAGEAATAPRDSAAPAAKSPAPILTDEVRPTVRAEDFLPYFQIPASARKPGDVTLLVPGIPTPPAPGTLPASSATYTQTPK
jgi:hypothetical protein